MKNNKTLHAVAAILAVMAVWGCNPSLHQPLQTRSARIGEETKFTNLLRSLPLPKEKVVVAVYKFRDQTGQYKPADNVASWSTAVTQGGTNILLKALEDSGWFVPIERENVNNLLNERKIIRSSRQQFVEEDEKEGALLSPLLYAGVILEGGIVSYDANVVTGGAGLRYFGTGASGQYRQDRVTVYLRAVSTKSGKILKTVYTSKTLLSQAVDVGVFRFVSFERLLEAETGITYNEPTELAVTEAIEKAVHSLILEGVMDNMWVAKDTEKKKVEEAVKKYKAERDEMRQTDVMGWKAQRERKSTGLSVHYAGLRYEGDFANPQLRQGLELGFEQVLGNQFSIGLNFGSGALESEEVFVQKFSYFDLNLKYRLLPQNRFSPFFQGGVGALLMTNGSPFKFEPKGYQKIWAGIGLEYLMNNSLGFQLAFDNNYLLNDQFDQMDHGKYNDYFWRTRVGMIFYFGKNK